MTRSTEIEALVAETPGPANAGQILAWFQKIEDRIDRGDLMLGLLTVREVELVPRALRHAAEADPVAWVLLAEWLKAPPLDVPDLEGADEALTRALGAGLDEAGLELAELRWFHRRETASEEERREAYRLVEQATQADPEDGEAWHLLGLPWGL